MDWDKAKTLTIVFLLFLDAFLGISIYLERDKYYIDTQQFNKITELLKKNDIYLNTSDLPSHRPLQQLSMSSYKYDETEIINMLFTEPKNVRQRDELDGKTVFLSGDQTLTIQNGFITFDCPSGTNDIELSQETALAEANRFIEGLGEISDFIFDSCFIDEEGWRIQFCNKYKDYIIYTNYVEFLVTNKGIVQIDCIYSRPKGFFGLPAELCSVDEALLHFMQHFKDAYENRPAEVIKVDLVYYQKEGSVTDNASLTALPHYRITVGGFEQPFLINAYLNRIEQF